MKSILSVLFSFAICLTIVASNETYSNGTSNIYKPVVMFHGLGDTAYGSIRSLIKLTRQELNDSVYVTSVEMGNGIRGDFFGSYFNNVNDKLAEICKKLRADQNLKDGFSFVTFSQGGQFARALVQRCDLKVLNLITLGAQHQGIFGLPRCSSENHYICLITDRLFNIGFYNDLIQSHFVPAQYWHDAIDYENYVKHSKFIAEINNEVNLNQIYKQRLSSLKRFVMIKFDADTIVDPPESEHFGFFAPNDTKQIIKLEDSRLYKEDRLGLKKLDEDGKLIRITLPGDHLQITRDWFNEEIIRRYLKTEINLN